MRRAPFECSILLLLLWISGVGEAASVAHFRAQVIVASKQPGARVDPALAPLVSRLRQSLAYSSYRLIQEVSGSAGKGQRWTANLPQGHTLQVTPTQLDGAVTARIEVLRGGRSISVIRARLDRRGQPAIVGGFPYGEGVLIIAIFVR